MRRATFLMPALAVFLFAGAANAEPDDPVVAARFATLERFVAHASAETRTARHWHGGTALAFGGFAVGLGLTHLGEDTRVQGIVLTTTGGLTILSGLYELFLDQRRFEQLRSAMANAAELDPVTRLATVEAAWDDLAAREARRRRAFALLRTVAGGLLMATSGFLAWAPDGWFAGNPTGRTRAAMTIAGTGIATTGLGLHDLLVKSPFEEARDAYRTAMPTLSLGPGTMMLRGAF